MAEHARRKEDDDRACLPMLRMATKMKNIIRRYVVRELRNNRDTASASMIKLYVFRALKAEQPDLFKEYLQGEIKLAIDKLVDSWIKRSKNKVEEAYERYFEDVKKEVKKETRKGREEKKEVKLPKELQVRDLDKSLARRKQGQDKERKKIERLSSQINRTGRFSVSPTFKKNLISVSGTGVKGSYYQLIGKKTLGTDKRLMNDIFEYRKPILQKRITCEVGLYGEKGEAAKLKMFQTLIEHGQDVANFWEGIEIDPSSFTKLVGTFAGEMAKKDVRSVTIIRSPIKRTKVTDVTTNFTFV